MIARRVRHRGAGSCERREAELALLPIKRGVVAAQHRLPKRVDARELRLLQREWAQLRRAFGVRVVLRLETQHHVPQIEGQSGTMASSAPGQSRCEGRLQPRKTALLHPET